MILLAALAGGLLAGWAWACWRKRPYQPPELRSAWLAVVAFLPQLLLAYIPSTRRLIPSGFGAAALAASLVVFLAFVWINRRLPGMPVLIVGLLLNLAVILANGGWMPISPETASRVMHDDVTRYAAIGDRFGQKDVLTDPEEMQLGLLADRFTLPGGLPYQAAFSLGDLLIAAGVFWLLARPAAVLIPSHTE